MTGSIRVGVSTAGLLLGLFACGGDRSPLADIAVEALSEGTALDVASEIDCDGIQAKYLAVVDANRACTLDADCALVPSVQWTCDGIDLLGEGRGDAINLKGAEEAQALYDLYRSDACAAAEHHELYDAVRGVNLRCEDGICQSDEAQSGCGWGYPDIIQGDVVGE